MKDMIAAAPPPSGPPDDGGLIAQAGRSLDADLSAVRLHSGDGVAEGAGAAALARGQDIHVANAAVGADGKVEPKLLAHELAHVPQQRREATGGDLEGEADRAGDAILAGRPFEIEGGTGIPTIQKETWTEWLYNVTPSFTLSTSDTDAEQSEPHAPTDPAHQTYYGTDTPILDDKRQPKVAPTNSYEVHDRTSTERDATTQIPTGSKTMEGATTTRVQGDTTSTGVDRTTTSWSWPSLSWMWSREQGQTTSTVDHEATATKVKTALEEKASAVERQIEADVRPALTERVQALQDVAGRRAGLVDEERRRLAAQGVIDEAAVLSAAKQRPEYAQLEAAEVALTEDVQQLQAKKLDLERQAAQARTAAGGVTAQNASAVAGENGVLVEAATKQGGSTTTKTGQWDGNLLDDGKVGYTDTTKTVDSGSATTTTYSHNTSVKVGGGLMVEDTRKHEQSVGAPGQEIKSGSGQTFGGGLVAKGDGEYGVGGSMALEDTTAAGTTYMKESKQLTNEGYYAQSELGGKTTRGGGAGKPTVDGGVKVSVDRSFTVESRPVKGSDPPMTDLVVTIRAGGTFGANAGVKGENADGKLGASAEGAIGGSAALVFTHRLDPEEAEEYLGALDDVEAGQSPAGDHPELGLLARMQVVGDQLAEGDGANALAVVDATGARSLGSGDSVELTLTGTASAKGELGGSPKGGDVGTGAGLTVNGGASAEGSRKVKVSSVTDEDGRKLVELTVAFSSTTGWNAGAKGTYGAGTMGGSYATSATEGESVTFRLDPEAQDYDFDAIYDTIVRAATLSELRALEKDPAIGQHATKLVQSDAGSEAVGGTAGLALGGVVTGELGLSNKQSHTNDLEIGPGGVGGAFTGANESKGSFSVNGVAVASATSTAQATTQRKADSMSIELEEAESGSGPGAQGMPSVGDVLADGPKKALEKALTDSWSRVLKGTTLSDRDVRALFGRARDETLWSRCAEFASPRVYLAWMGLAEDLVAPSSRPDLAEIDERGAAEVAQLQAIAVFVERHGEPAIDVLRNATHHWGQGVGEWEQSGEDLGSTFEWPEGIVRQRDEFEKLRIAVADLPSRLSGTMDSDGRRLVEGISERLQKLYDAVAACNSFVEPRAKLDLLDDIGQFQAITSQLRGQFERGEALDPNSCSDSEGLAVALAEVGRLEVLMEQYKASEADMFTRIKSYFSVEQTSYWEGFKASQRMMWAPHEVNIDLSRLGELYEAWVEDIKKLRAAYHASDTADAPMVSLTPQEPRNTTAEPDVPEFNRLWTLGQRHDTSSLDRALADHIRRFARY